MGHTAVLFCPDEKVARVVSLVLSEVGFMIEPVPESFQAVNRLVAQHYDAIILDCDNIENAALLLRSARSSSFNRDSLVIALAEGQVGVANAYRIGANLALTKPINVEQARGTLRVARGLLRKNAEAARPATDPGTVPVSSRQASAPNAHFFENGHFHENVGADSQFVAEAVAAEPPLAASSQEASISALNGPAGAGNPAGASMPWARVEAAKPVSQNASQPSGQFGKRDLPNGTGPNTGVFADEGAFDSRSGPSRATGQNLYQRSSGLPATAAAATPAKEQPSADEGGRSDEEVLAKSAPRAPFLDQGPTVEVKPGCPWQEFPDRENAPSSQLFAGFTEKPPRTPRSHKKLLMAAIAVLVLAVAGYFGWAKFSATNSNRTTAGIATPGTARLDSGTLEGVPPQTQRRVSLQATAPGRLRSNAISNSRPAPDSSRSGNRDQAATLSPGQLAAVLKGSSPQSDKSAQNDPRGWIAVSLGSQISAQQKPAVITVPAEKKPAASADKTQAEDSTPPAPNPVEVSFSPDRKSLNGVLPSETNVSTPTLASIRLSQGVSGGLLIKRVQPTYPASARAAHVQGTVQIKARIDKEGRVFSPPC